MRLVETNEIEAKDLPTPRNSAPKTLHCKMYNLMEHTTVTARERVCIYGIPVAIGQRKHEGRGH